MRPDIHELDQLYQKAEALGGDNEYANSRLRMALFNAAPEVISALRALQQIARLANGTMGRANWLDMQTTAVEALSNFDYRAG